MKYTVKSDGVMCSMKMTYDHSGTMWLIVYSETLWREGSAMKTICNTIIEAVKLKKPNDVCKAKIIVKMTSENDRDWQYNDVTNEARWNTGTINILLIWWKWK